MPDESNLIFSGIKAMLLPYRDPRTDAFTVPPNFYAPYGWFLVATIPGGGVGQPPLLPPDVYANSILFDPFNYFSDVPEGATVSTGTPFIGPPSYKATADQTRAMVTVRFETVTVAEGAIQSIVIHNALAGSGDPGFIVYDHPHYGRLYPAGTATNDGEYTFFPPDGVHGYAGPDLGPPGGWTSIGAGAGPYYDPVNLVILSDGSGVFGPPDPMPLDVFAPSGEYLVGHIGFPTGSYYLGGGQNINAWSLSSLSLHPAAPPYVSSSQDRHDFPLVQMRFGPYSIGGGGGGAGYAPPTVAPALLGCPTGHYNRAADLTSTAGTLGIYFWRSDRPVPLFSGGHIWDTGTQPHGGPVNVTRQNADNSPRLAQDRRGLLYLLFSRPSSGAMLTRSDDDGDTWNTPTLAIPGGTHPNIVSADGRTLCAAVTTTGSGTSAVRHLTGVYRGPGDSTFRPAFTFLNDATGAPLSVADDSFGLARAAEGPDRLALHVLMAGETATSDWWSANEGLSWHRIPLS